MILPAGLVLAGISLLATANLGASGARAGGGGQGHTPVTICHWVPAHGGSYIVITVDDDGAFQGHAGHPNDIIPAPAGSCPGATGTPTGTATPTGTRVPTASSTPTPTSTSAATATNTPHGGGHTPVTICHWVPAHGGSYILITVDDDGAFGGHAGHPNDIIPAPPGGCPTPTDTPTRTATPTSTGTPVATNTPTMTPTSVPTATNTAVPTATNTPPGGGHKPVTICHWVPAHGGSYIVITVDDDGAFEGHAGHPNDIIPAPADGCPAPTATPTNTPTATSTSVPAATNTPTATPTDTATPIATATDTPTPTTTATDTVTSTATRTNSPTATATPTTAPATPTRAAKTHTPVPRTRTPVRSTNTPVPTATRVNIVLGSTPPATRTVVSTTALPGTGSGNADANGIVTGLLGTLLLAAGLGLAAMGLRRSAS